MLYNPHDLLGKDVLIKDSSQYVWLITITHIDKYSIYYEYTTIFPTTNGYGSTQMNLLDFGKYINNPSTLLEVVNTDWSDDE